MKQILAISPRIFLSGCLMITALIVATPLYPLMPTAGLDPSWKFAINQAVAQNLAFGREVVFTFGPYGAVYSQLFHPGTDVLAMSAGLYFGVCFGTVAILLALRSFWWGMGLLLVIGGQMYVRDVLFISYGLLLTIAINNAVWSNANRQGNLSPRQGALFGVLLISGAGLLGSLLQRTGLGALGTLLKVLSWLAFSGVTLIGAGAWLRAEFKAGTLSRL